MHRIDLNDDELFRNAQLPGDEVQDVIQDAVQQVEDQSAEITGNSLPISEIKFARFSDLQNYSISLEENKNVGAKPPRTLLHNRPEVPCHRRDTGDIEIESEGNEIISREAGVIDSDANYDLSDSEPADLEHGRRRVGVSKRRDVNLEDHVRLYDATREGMDTQRYNIIRSGAKSNFSPRVFELFAPNLGHLTINDKTGVATVYWKFPQKKKLYRVERRRALTYLAQYGQTHLLILVTVLTPTASNAYTTQKIFLLRADLQ